MPTDVAMVNKISLEIKIVEMLKTVHDPELPADIYELGLVYDINISDNGFVNIKMTLTAPGCGMGTVIASDAQQKLMYVNGVEDAAVDIVWDPPWHQSMITAQGRKVLGIE